MSAPDKNAKKRRRRRGPRHGQEHAPSKTGEVKPQAPPRPARSPESGEKRYNTLEEFWEKDEIQQLPNSFKISKLADARSKDEDQVVVSANLEAEGIAYFFDVHDLKDNERMLTIMQSAMENGEFKRSRIMVTRKNLPRFLDELRKVLGFFLV